MPPAARSPVNWRSCNIVKTAAIAQIGTISNQRTFGYVAAYTQIPARKSGPSPNATLSKSNWLLKAPRIDKIIAGTIVTAEIQVRNFPRPNRPSNCCPKDQKKATLISAKNPGISAIGHVTTRQISPLRTLAPLKTRRSNSGGLAAQMNIEKTASEVMMSTVVTS